MSSKLIVGLGNPGKEYHETRHNAGEDFIDIVARKYKVAMKKENKFSSYHASFTRYDQKVHLIKPDYFMNESGIAVSKIIDYLDIDIQNTLVIHDELDLPFGEIKFKESGGHGGHNGLRNIIDHLNGNSSFKRLRIGIGHPGKDKDVTSYVLGKASEKERELLETNMENCLNSLDLFIEDKWQKAMFNLHTKKD